MGTRSYNEFANDSAIAWDCILVPSYFAICLKFGDGCYDKYVFYRNQNSTCSAVSIFTKDVIAGRKYLAVFDV
jgi:hypothetical protein